ncbi:MAG TPA: hypothetical protein VJZ71_08155 [Phycisphaerae bacterium]|nr:hypothetical protein [Phycisphaerae bacterium]
MKPIHGLVLTCAIVLGMTAGIARGQTASFRRLGDLPGGGVQSLAFGLSTTGSN